MFLEFKFRPALPKYDLTNLSGIGLTICAWGTQVLWLLTGIACYFIFILFHVYYILFFILLFILSFWVQYFVFTMCGDMKLDRGPYFCPCWYFFIALDFHLTHSLSLSLSFKNRKTQHSDTGIESDIVSQYCSRMWSQFAALLQAFGLLVFLSMWMSTYWTRLWAPLPHSFPHQCLHSSHSMLSNWSVSWSCLWTLHLSGYMCVLTGYRLDDHTLISDMAFSFACTFRLALLLSAIQICSVW